VRERANLYAAIWRRPLPSVFSRRFYTLVRQVRAVVNAITCFSHKRYAVVAAAAATAATGSHCARQPRQIMSVKRAESFDPASESAAILSISISLDMAMTPDKGRFDWKCYVAVCVEEMEEET